MTAVLARIVKTAMVLVLLPITVGLLLGILRQLEVMSLSGGTFRDWVQHGFLTYVGLHLLLYRPVGLFRVGHRIFSALAIWLFGGQVTAVEDASTGSGKGAKGGKAAAAKPPTEGSTLVAFSPYVVPLYVVLVCLAGWGLRQWLARSLVDGPIAFLIGVTIAFHWIMTADDLQQQRSRWHIETYLLALGLVFVLTLLIGSACLHWAIPEFSSIEALSDGLTSTQAIYTMFLQRLFL